jgi:hypothetical protein
MASLESATRMFPSFFKNSRKLFAVRAGPRPFDLPGRTRTWSYARSPCRNNESLSAFGDSTVAENPRAAVTCQRRDYALLGSEHRKGPPYRALEAVSQAYVASNASVLLHANGNMQDTANFGKAIPTSNFLHIDDKTTYSSSPPKTHYTSPSHSAPPG